MIKKIKPSQSARKPIGYNWDYFKKKTIDFMKVNKAF